MTVRYKVAIFPIAFMAIFLFWPEKVFADNFLQNGDFESGDIDSWSSSGGGATADISSDLVHDGEYALKVQHSKTGSYGFQQTVSDIEGGLFYEVSGYGATADFNVASYFLRVAWYESNDGSGSQLSSPVDTDKGEQTDGSWIWFESVVQAPANANSVKVRVVLNSKTDGIIAVANFDDIVFQETAAPEESPSEEPEEESSHSPKASPFLSSTPSPIPVNVTGATFLGRILGEGQSTSAGFYPWEATEEGESQEATENAKIKSLPKIIFVLGLILLLSAATHFCYNQRK